MYAGLVNFFNTTIAPGNQKHGYSKPVEQYRGLCALLVLIGHGTVDIHLLFNNFEWPEFVKYMNAGRLSVLIFFCISGYVIGITNDKLKLDVKSYLKKRLIRLYPTYLIAIILCVIVAGSVSLYMLLGNVFFLQNDLYYYSFKIPIFINYPSWSLNYEALYYLLFIPVFFLRPKLWKMLLVMLALSVLLIHSNPYILFISNYITGFYFWMLGLIIGWNIFKIRSESLQMPLLSLLFLHMCMHHLGIGQIILHVVGIYSTTSINWLFDLPFCLMLMCVLTGKNNPFLKFNKLLTYAMPACVFLYLAVNHRLFEDIRWIMCLIYWGLSLALYFEKRISAILADKLTFVGQISYGLYLLHVPVAGIIKKTVFINDPVTEIIVKYTLWLTLTFALSYVLEKRLQPAVKRYFSPA
ncbi:MAG: acyltransferase [Sphingobacteriaceae bacterium]|nr:MAG: acyltransferase [Sphingobacteriaceae bacterium]